MLHSSIPYTFLQRKKLQPCITFFDRLLDKCPSLGQTSCQDITMVLNAELMKAEAGLDMDLQIPTPTVVRRYMNTLQDVLTVFPEFCQMQVQILPEMLRRIDMQLASMEQATDPQTARFHAALNRAFTSENKEEEAPVYDTEIPVSQSNAPTSAQKSSQKSAQKSAQKSSQEKEVFKKETSPLPAPLPKEKELLQERERRSDNARTREPLMVSSPEAVPTEQQSSHRTSAPQPPCATSAQLPFSPSAVSRRAPTASAPASTASASATTASAPAPTASAPAPTASAPAPTSPSAPQPSTAFLGPYRDWTADDFRLHAQECRGHLPSEEMLDDFIAYWLQPSPDGLPLFKTMDSFSFEFRMGRWYKHAKSREQAESARNALTATAYSAAAGSYSAATGANSAPASSAPASASPPRHYETKAEANARAAAICREEIAQLRASPTSTDTFLRDIECSFSQ